MEIVARPHGARGFRPPPRRWVIERTFAWQDRHRRLACDWEAASRSGCAAIHVADRNLKARRLARLWTA